MADRKLEENKRVVERLFEVIYGEGDNFDLCDEFVADDYIQHNPLAGQGLAGLKAFLNELVPLPEWLTAEHTESVLLIAEGDLVVRQEIRDHGMLVDIFRVEDGMLQEHWDAFRPNPGTERLPGF